MNDNPYESPETESEPAKWSPVLVDRLRLVVAAVIVSAIAIPTMALIFALLDG